MFVGDYKTARYDGGKDHLLAQYHVQLAGYAFLLAMNGYSKPERAALFYLIAAAQQGAFRTDSTFGILSPHR